MQATDALCHLSVTFCNVWFFLEKWSLCQLYRLKCHNRNLVNNRYRLSRYLIALKSCLPEKKFIITYWSKLNWSKYLFLTFYSKSSITKSDFETFLLSCTDAMCVFKWSLLQSVPFIGFFHHYAICSLKLCFFAYLALYMLILKFFSFRNWCNM